MNVLVSGSTGLIGYALVPMLSTGGHRVARLVRHVNLAGEDAIYWNPETWEIDARRLQGFDAIVHLAGENIAARRWNSGQMARIRDSRIRGTRLLCESLAAMRRPPRVLVSASAIGFYGKRGDEILTESSPAGEGFLPDVCRAWEEATEPAQEAGIRVVQLRFGIVLSPRGGALAKMLTPFRFGLGGRIGSGRQWMSWIALDDAVGVIYDALATQALCGPVNAVAPDPVMNRDFTKTLGLVLRRPTPFPMPEPFARLAFGKMADELLLGSTRVRPNKLLQSGYQFLYADLASGLRHLLGATLGSGAQEQPASSVCGDQDQVPPGR